MLMHNCHVVARHMCTAKRASYGAAALQLTAGPEALLLTGGCEPYQLTHGKDENNFDKHTQNETWSKLPVVRGRDPKRFRFDHFGNLLCRRHNCGNFVTSFNFDHIVPQIEGELSVTSNCQPIHYKSGKLDVCPVELKSKCFSLTFSSMDIDVIEIATYGNITKNGNVVCKLYTNEQVARFLADTSKAKWESRIPSFDKRTENVMLDLAKKLKVSTPRWEPRRREPLHKVEATFAESLFVDKILIHRTKLCSIALVVPVASELEKWASEKKMIFSDFTDLCKKQEAAKAVLGSLSEVAKKAKLEKPETPVKIQLIPDKWTFESGLVSANRKLNREAIKNKYKSELDELCSCS